MAFWRTQEAARASQKTASAPPSADLGQASKAPAQNSTFATSGAVATGRKMLNHFGTAVSILMRSPALRHHSLADLEWLLIPPLAAGQAIIAGAKVDSKTSMTVPTALVLWANVSNGVDARLQASGQLERITPAEWTSGTIPWVIVAVGEDSIVRETLAHLSRTQWQTTPAKMHGRGPDGRPKILMLRNKTSA